MKILLLAPHPFYQERGTPIAVDLLVRKLSERGDSVDILTFHEGEDRHYPNVTIHRISPVLNISNITPGFSIKKLYCDAVLFFKMAAMLNRYSYDLIHAVEESATMAMLYKPISKVPYIYDMDSVITEQLLEKSPKFKPAVPVVRYFESRTIKYSKAVVAVCQAIADYACRYKQDDIYLLKDISLISSDPADGQVDDLRSLAEDGVKIGLYIGNLEGYQGIDLLIESLSVYAEKNKQVCMLIIGGNTRDIDHYTARSERLGLSGMIRFLGPRPIAHMNTYMQQADFLVSPRIKGINTPMKVYSYLASGVPVLATALPTHTQVMNDDIAFLSAANAQAFSATMSELVSNPDLAERKSASAKEFIRLNHSIEAFTRQLNLIYDAVEASLDNQT